MKLATPVAISTTFFANLEQLGIPEPVLVHGVAPTDGSHYDAVLSADGSSILEWNFPFPLPVEADVIAAVSDLKANHIRGFREPLLLASDVIASRCVKAGMAFPVEWRTYVQALRDWPENGGGQPVTPALPAGI